MPAETIEITQIDALIHPDYLLMGRIQGITLHPRQQELREAWDQRVLDIANNPNSAMLYFSCLNNPSYPRELLPDDSNIDELIEFDRMRMNRYADILGRRFIGLERTNLPDQKNVTEGLAKRGLNCKGSHVDLYSYGELYEACVMAWNKGVKLALGIPDERCHYRTQVCKSLSLGLDNGWEVTKWWQDKGFKLRP
jgi:hypothetical protein